MSDCVICGPMFIGKCPHRPLEKIGMPSPYSEIERLRADMDLAIAALKDIARVRMAWQLSQETAKQALAKLGVEK